MRYIIFYYIPKFSIASILISISESAKLGGIVLFKISLMSNLKGFIKKLFKPESFIQLLSYPV